MLYSIRAGKQIPWVCADTRQPLCLSTALQRGAGSYMGAALRCGDVCRGIGKEHLATMQYLTDSYNAALPHNALLLYDAAVVSITTLL